MRLTTAAKVVFCTLIMIVGATGALSAAAATPNIDLTKGATIDNSTVEGGTVNGLITADNPDTDVQLFLDLNRDETVDSGEPTLTVSAGDLNSSGTAPFSGLSVPIGAENGKVDIIAVQRNSTLSVDDAVTPNITETTRLDAASDGRLVVDSDFDKGEFDTIQAAVNAASAGDTIRVRPGTYNENVSLDTPNLALSGPNNDISGDSVTRGSEATIQAQETNAIEITADNVTVSGFEIQNPAGSGDGSTSVNAVGVKIDPDNKNISITNNSIRRIGTQANTNVIGVYAERGSNRLTIADNKLADLDGTDDDEDRTQAILLIAQEGSNVGSITGANISGNVITNVSDGRSVKGIELNGNVSANITDNEISVLDTDGPTDTGFTQAIALGEGSNADTGPADVNVENNSVSKLEPGPVDDAFVPTHLIISAAGNVGTISVTNNDFTAGIVDENYILDRAARDFDLESARSANTFDPVAVQVTSGSDRKLVRANVSNVDQGTGFRSIQAAVDAATDGDTIRVRNATYRQSVTIETSNITLTGVNNPTIVGDGADTGSQPHAAIHVNGNGPTRETTIEGFTIRNPDGHYGVYAGTGGSNSDVDGFELRGNVIKDIATNRDSHKPLAGSVAGLYVRAQYDSLIVENNTVKNINTTGDPGQNAVGLSFSSFIGDAAFDDSDKTSEAGDDTTVSNNTISGVSGAKSSRTKGISVSGEFDDLTIESNTITGVSAPTSDSTVLGITLTENPPKSGVDPDSDGTDERIGPRNFVVRNNTINKISAGTPVGVFVGGYEDLGDNTVVADNTINAPVSRFNGDQDGFNFADADGLAFRDNDVTASQVPPDLDRVGAVSGNSLSTSAFDARIDATSDRSDIATGDVPPVTTRLQTLLSNNDLATTAPATVANISLENPSARSLDLSVTTTGNVSESTLSVALGNATNGTGSDVTIDEFAETENADGTFTYTASVEADVAPGSVQTYEATVTEVDGNTDPDGVLPRSRSRTLAVAAFDGSTATVATGSTVVSEASIDLGDATGTTVSVSAVSTLPDTQEQSRSALQSDIDGVDGGDTVVSALDIDPGSSLADTNASLQFTIARTSIADPENLVVARFTGTEYEPLPVTVVESDGTDVTLEAQTPGFSLFAIVETDGPSPTVGTGGSGGGGGAGGGGGGGGGAGGGGGGGGGAGGGGGGGGGAGISTDVSSGRPVDGVGPYTLRPSGSISEVTVTFDQPANGVIRASEVSGFPAEAPRFGGQVLAAVDIQAPSEAGPSTVRLSIPRSSVDDAGVLPSDLQIAHYEQDRGRIEPLSTAVVSANSQTVVLSAETPGFSVFAVVTQPARVTATPEPTATLEPTATPEATSERTTTTPTPDGGDQEPEPDEVTTSGRAPGFALTGTILSLLAAALIALRRR